MADNKESQPVTKAESHEGLVVPTQRERGQPRIVTSSRFINDVKKRELSDIPQRLCAFETMCLDADVHSALQANLRPVRRALAGGKFVSTGTRASDDYAEFLNYNIRNMTYGTWLEAIRDMTTATKCGWSDLNIVTERRNYGPYRDKRVLRKLSPRDQNSVYGWLWNDDFTEWKGFVQRPSYEQRRGAASSGNRFENGLNLLAAPKYIKQGYPVIRDTQVLHTAYNGTNRNPQGDSPLLHCYDDWFEKRLITNFEVAGISKDMAGVLVLRVPSELIEKANLDPTGPEAAEYKSLQENAADLHQGKSSYIVLTSDADPNTRLRDYDFELKGIDGGL